MADHRPNDEQPAGWTQILAPGDTFTRPDNEGIRTDIRRHHLGGWWWTVSRPVPEGQWQTGAAGGHAFTEAGARRRAARAVRRIVANGLIRSRSGSLGPGAPGHRHCRCCPRAPGANCCNHPQRWATFAPGANTGLRSEAIPIGWACGNCGATGPIEE